MIRGLVTGIFWGVVASAAVLSLVSIVGGQRPISLPVPEVAGEVTPPDGTVADRAAPETRPEPPRAAPETASGGVETGQTPTALPRADADAPPAQDTARPAPRAGEIAVPRGGDAPDLPAETGIAGLPGAVPGRPGAVGGPVPSAPQPDTPPAARAEAPASPTAVSPVEDPGEGPRIATGPETPAEEAEPVADAQEAAPARPPSPEAPDAPEAGTTPREIARVDDAAPAPSVANAPGARPTPEATEAPAVPGVPEDTPGGETPDLAEAPRPDPAPPAAAPAPPPAETAPDLAEAPEPPAAGAAAPPDTADPVDPPEVAETAPPEPDTAPRRIEPDAPRTAERVPTVRTNRLPQIGGVEAPESEPAPELADTPQGDGALERYSAPFDNPGGQPVIAVVLVLDPAGGDAMLDGVPFPVTVAIDAAAPGASEAAARLRAAGRELVLIPSLPEGATPADVEVALQSSLDLLPEAVAVMDGVPQGPAADRNAVAQMVAAAAASGHGLVSFPRGFNTAIQLAERDGVPAALIFREIDAGNADMGAIRMALDRAAFRARQEGGVVLAGRARPETVAALTEWALGDRAESIALAPVSAVLRGEAGS